MVSALPDGVDGGDPEPLFLVEVVAPGLGTRGALRMAGALERATARLNVAGAHLAWRGGLFVPTQSRCVSLLEAESDVVVRRVCDVAGLATATVHRVTLLRTGTKAPVPPEPAPSGHLGEEAATSRGRHRPG